MDFDTLLPDQCSRRNANPIQKLSKELLLYHVSLHGQMVTCTAYKSCAKANCTSCGTSPQKTLVNSVGFMTATPVLKRRPLRNCTISDKLYDL
jgi:hypothetical protein